MDYHTRPTRSADIEKTATGASRPSDPPDEIFEVSGATAVNVVTTHIASGLDSTDWRIRRRGPSGTIDCRGVDKIRKALGPILDARPYSRVCSPTIAGTVSSR